MWHLDIKGRQEYAFQELTEATRLFPGRHSTLKVKSIKQGIPLPRIQYGKPHETREDVRKNHEDVGSAEKEPKLIHAQVDAKPELSDIVFRLGVRPDNIQAWALHHSKVYQVPKTTEEIEEKYRKAILAHFLYWIDACRVQGS